MSLARALKLYASDARQGVSSLFSRKVAPPPPAPSPLGLRLGGAFAFDRLTTRLLAGEVKAPLPAETQLIAACGHIDLGNGVVVHRYYSSDACMLEVCTNGGFRPENVDSVRLFVPFDTVHPLSREEWEFWIGEHDPYIGYKLFEIKDGTTYDRVWFDNHPGNVPPCEFAEHVTTRDGSDEAWLIEHRAMLYARTLPDAGRAEYLLVSAEDTGTTSEVELMTGIDIGPSELSVT